MGKISNLELWNKLRKIYPTFSNHTSEGTADTFTERGFEQIKNFDSSVLNEFFNLSMRVYLQQVNISKAVDRFDSNGFGEYYENSLGGYIQRLSVSSVKPISPAYKGLTNGGTLDPFVVKKPETQERFFKQNFDYQSLITIPDEFQFKQIFISEFGMSEYMSGIMEGLKNGYTIQLYLNKLEAINAGINSTKFPLQETQKVDVPMSDEPTTEELTELILSIKNIITNFEVTAQTGDYNALKFSSVQDVSRLKLLVRAGFKNLINVKVLTSAYNPEKLNLPIDVIEVENFGGLEPYKEEGYTTKLYPVYDKLGSVIGYNTSEGQTEVTVQSDAVYWKDVNADVIGIIADKGWLFHSIQNPYTVEPIRNPRGLYTNYWASSPNNTIAIDHLYNCIVLKKTAVM